MKQNIFWFIIGTIIAISGFMASNNFAYGQVTENLTAQPVLNEWIKIINPIEGQQVPVGKELIVSGESSDNVFKNCTCLSYSQQHKAISKCASVGSR